MKKIYTLIAAVAVTFGAVAQDDFKVNLLSHAPGAIDDADPLTFQFEVENAGTTTHAIGDTLWVSIALDGGIMSLGLDPGFVNRFILTETMAPGSKLIIPEIGIDWLDQTEPTNVELCAVVYGIGVASFSGAGPSIEEIIVGDDDLSNNTACITVILPVSSGGSGIEDFETALASVYVANGNLMVVNSGVTVNEQANLNIVSMNGQLVQSSNFVLVQGTSTIDVSNLSTGIYLVSIEVEGAVISKKVAIQ